MYDMIIVGAGTAGLTAGIYALRSGVKPLILECEAMGGQITLSPCVENYPGIAKISGMEVPIVCARLYVLPNAPEIIA